MAEHLRSVTVHIEVDTSKNTYPLFLSDVDLILSDVDLETAQREIAKLFGHMEDL